MVQLKKWEWEELKVCCWNCEDFYQYSPKNTSRYQMRYELTNNPIMEELKSADIILLQEWNQQNGASFFYYLESFERMFVDRTAVLYKKGKFTDPKYLEIPLLWEKPSVFERTYTTGRQKKNIFAKLLYRNVPIYISCFHLSAYIPYFHKKSLGNNQYDYFHSRQLTAYLNDCLSSDLFTNRNSIQNGTCDFSFIIGGDTNFNDGHMHADLFTFLLSPFKGSKFGLHDVCDGYCDNIYTQDFLCTHEEGAAKVFARAMMEYSKNQRSRLDFLATNWESDKPKIIKVCGLSDHSLISTVITPPPNFNPMYLTAGYQPKKTFFTKTKRKTRKMRKMRKNRKTRIYKRH
jgi:hypothetical protein